MSNPADLLAQDIRTINGDHTLGIEVLGAGVLAQKLVDLGWQPPGTAAKVTALWDELREAQLFIRDETRHLPTVQRIDAVLKQNTPTS